MKDYLRRQADACLRIARGGFDLGTAERLRVLASELRAKADELEQEQRANERKSFQSAILKGAGSSPH
jgi:hypothetical protein